MVMGFINRQMPEKLGLTFDLKTPSIFQELLFTLRILISFMSLLKVPYMDLPKNVEFINRKMAEKPGKMFCLSMIIPEVLNFPWT